MKLSRSTAFYSPVDSIAEARATALQKQRDRLFIAFERILSRKEREFQSLAVSIDSLSPLKTMSRGYAAILKSGGSVKSAAELEVGDTVNLRLIDGGAVCEVKEVK